MAQIDETRKALANDQTGNFEDLRINAEDPSDTITDTKDPDLGKTRLLVWNIYLNADGQKYYEAQGKDGTVYRIEPVIPAPPAIQGKVTIIPKEEVIK